MDLLVLCTCGHPQGMHSPAGCQAGRFVTCPCPLRPDEVVDEAIRVAQTTTRFAFEARPPAHAAPASAREDDSD